MQRKRCSLGNPKIHVVFTDLGNVLVRFCDRTERLFQLAQLAKPDLYCGKSEEIPQRRQALLAALEDLGVFDAGHRGAGVAWKLDTGCISQDDLYRAFVSATGCDPAEFPPARFWLLYGADLQAVPQTCRLMEEVRAHGIAVIAATNTEDWPADVIRRQSGLQFHDVVMSWKVGYTKPAAEFFAACLAAARGVLRSTPLHYSDCLLLDDIPAYCDAFVQLGGNAIQFKASARPKTLARQMQKPRRQFKERGLLP